ncbi:aminotransferase class IV, partial [Pseudomonas aeruginosa]
SAWSAAGMFSNLLLVLDGTLVAPDLRRCGVAGVMRAELLERAEGIGVPLAIRDVSMAELATADEVFLCNSQFGIWPVRALDEHVWPVGELTRKLQDQLRDDLDF